MLYRVIDKNGNCLVSTAVEKIARRLVNDNPERDYRLIRAANETAGLR